ncbi:hypothetical protein NT6N_23010 [Oceaniferula spumae]|uniref:Sigma-70 family RNA polymerase sigma factor n=1 Tax=Oceaniferula spumae TaxID=2979115 RepID=A0AAT9FMW9_9BACT
MARSDENSDTALLKLWVQQRDEPAFHELVRRHSAFVHRAARGVCGDDTLAADACQLTFITLAKKATSLLTRPTLAGWLHTTAVMHSRNLIRARKRDSDKNNKFHTHMAIHDPSQLPDHYHEGSEHLDVALSELSQRDREALLLRYYQACSVSETAELLGIATHAAQKRLSRALERLRNKLNRRSVHVSGNLGVMLTAAFTTKVEAAPTVATIASKAIAAAPPIGATTFLTTALTIMTTKTILTTAAVALLGSAIFMAVKKSPDSSDDATAITASGSAAQSPSRERQRYSRPTPNRNRSTDQGDTSDYSQLNAIYGEDKVKTARHISSDVSLYQQAYLKLLRDQIDHAPTGRPMLKDGHVTSLIDLAASDMTAGLKHGEHQITADQTAQLNAAIKSYLEREYATTQREIEQLRKNPKGLTELYLASDTYWRGEIDQATFQQRVSEAGIDPNGVASPTELHSRLNRYAIDPKLTKEMQKILTPEQREIINSRLQRMADIQARQETDIGTLSQRQPGMTLEKLGNMINDKAEKLNQRYQGQTPKYHE